MVFLLLPVMKHISIKYQQIFILVIASVFYFLLGINSINTWSVTNDEADHFSYGIRSAKGHPEKVIAFEDGSCMPVTMINVVPRVVEQLIHPNIVKNDGGVQDIKRGRYITLIAGFFILIFIYLWLLKISNASCATIGFALAGFCPNIISQSSLVTTDAYAALFFLATLYFLHQWYVKPTIKNFIIFSLVFAAAFLVKQSLLILIPLCFIFIVIKLVKTKSVSQSVLLIVLFCIINLLVLNIGFQFSYADHLNFKSTTFQLLMHNFLFADVAAKIFPAPFLQGVDEVMYMDNLPAGDVRNLPYIFINGDFVLTKTACKQFFFQTFLFKTPMLFLIGWGISLLSSIKSRQFTVTLLISLLPLLVLIFFTFCVQSKVGVRHLLIIYPFIIMAAAVAFSKLNSQWYIAIFALHICMVFYYRNNLLAYTNELVIDSAGKVNLAGSVNLEYNQCSITRASSGFSKIYDIDSAVNKGDTIRLQIAGFYYIPDSLSNKNNIFKNYSVVNIDRCNTVTVVKKTDKKKLNQ